MQGENIVKIGARKDEQGPIRYIELLTNMGRGWLRG